MKFKLDSYFLILLKRLAIVLVALSLTRLIFFFFNKESFPTAGIFDFTIGIWFDCITIAYYFLPFIILSLFPKLQEKKSVQWINKVLFFIALSLVVAMNLMDVEYFKFTGKRSTFDLFAILGAGSDFAQLVGSFIRDFWFLILFWLLIIIPVLKLYTNIDKHQVQTTFNGFKKIPLFVLSIAFVVFISRGGLVLKPVGTIEASQYASPENATLVLNTPFTMLKSYGKQGLELKTYYSEGELNTIFNPIQKSKAANILPNKMNVVIIMLESFGNEYVGAYSGKKSYTPFFDSIIGESWAFKYAFANGKKSIEGVPSILASLPSLMDNPYISSPYANNEINSLPSILKKFGYESAFYHGATNGSMRFNGFAAHMGFDHYVGRFEYNNDKHFDKTWGILDEYFNPWSVKQMSKLKAPFFATLFTLSSHHPYYVPPHIKDKLMSGPHPICKSINYGDYSLRKFFEEAKKQSWYDNTLFIMVADHTPASNNPLYSQKRFIYQIPIVFYHPGGKLPKRMEKTIFQQLDILPTTLDLLNIETEYYAYGHSYFSKAPREALSFMEGSFYYFTKNHMITFSKEKARNLYDFTSKKEAERDSIAYYTNETKQAEKRLKAIIQRYNQDLIHNKMKVK